MSRFLFTLGAAAIALSLSTGARAQNTDNREGAYVFGGVGAANTQWKAKRSALPAGQKRGEDESSTSYVLGGGYRFNRHFALESSYHDMLGSVSRRGIGSFDTRSLQISALGILPLGERFELFGKASLGRSRNQFAPAKGAPGVGRTSEYVNIATLGVGANYHFNDHVSLRLDIDGLTKASDSLSRKAGADDINTAEATLSLAYRF